VASAASAGRGVKGNSSSPARTVPTSWGPGVPGGTLEHLRSPGPHVRGCWVIDLILGKEW